MKTKRAVLPRVLLALLLIAAFVALAFFLNASMEKRIYRLDYPTQIRRYAQKYELDPYMVAAIVHCESGNDARAVSNKGAVGLMQLIPETGEWIAGKLKRADYDAVWLNEPETNIEFGCWYLRFLFERFDSANTVLAAYNAGQGNVWKWLDDSAYSKDGVSLDEIPYKETKEYVEKVQRAYDKYKKLYPDAFA